jgi:hypothetical protein
MLSFRLHLLFMRPAAARRTEHVTLKYSYRHWYAACTVRRLAEQVSFLLMIHQIRLPSSCILIVNYQTVYIWRPELTYPLLFQEGKLVPFSVYFLEDRIGFLTSSV